MKGGKADKNISLLIWRMDAPKLLGKDEFNCVRSPRARKFTRGDLTHGARKPYTRSQVHEETLHKVSSELHCHTERYIVTPEVEICRVQMCDISSE